MLRIRNLLLNEFILKDFEESIQSYMLKEKQLYVEQLVGRTLMRE